ncbi:MAG: sensor histidine kinase [Streptosporangiales bacterium]
MSEARTGPPAAWPTQLDAAVRRRPWVPDTLLALVLAASVGAVSLSSLNDLLMPGWAWFGLVLSLGVLHGCVAIRRQWPVPAFALASLAMLTVVALPSARTTVAATGESMQVPLLFVPSCLMYALMLTAVSARGRREALLALAVGSVGVALSGVRLAGSPVAGLTSSAWGLAFVLVALIAIVLAACVFGQLLAARANAARVERTHAVEHAVASERAAIAREMHDVVAHSLAVIVRQADAGGYVANTAPERAAEALRVVADTGREALVDMRGVLATLRAPAERQPVELGDALPQAGSVRGLAAVPDLLAGMRRVGLSVRVDRAGEEVALPTAADLAAYRVLQESLTNCLKHASPGTRVAVRLEWTGAELLIDVRDDGGGGGPAVPGSGLGLTGLHERLATVRGELSAGPDAAGGFAVRARIPYEPGEDDG